MATTAMTNEQLTYLIKSLEEEIERLRRLVEKSGVPDPLTVAKLIATKDITIGETALPIIYMESSANSGGSGYIYGFKEIGGDMILKFIGFDRIVAPDGTNIWS